jgi:hypothetical protein
MKWGFFAVAGAALVCVQAAGCADGQEPGADSAEALSSRVPAIDVPNPSGAFTAKLTAAGTGCPEGTWDARINPGGHSVTLLFTGAQIALQPGQELQIKDCTLALDLTAPEGQALAFSASNVGVRTFLDMTEGTTMRHSAKTYFTGNPIPAAAYHDTVGPLDDMVDAALSPFGDAPFSRCAATNRLNLLLRLVAHNNPQRTGTIFADDEPIDAIQYTAFGFDLDWKACGE